MLPQKDNTTIYTMELDAVYYKKIVYETGVIKLSSDHAHNFYFEVYIDNNFLKI